MKFCDANREWRWQRIEALESTMRAAVTGTAPLHMHSHAMKELDILLRIEALSRSQSPQPTEAHAAQEA